VKNLKIDLALIDDGKMQDLNKEYRKVDESTDVLSFPYNDDLPDGTYFLGEIVVNTEQTESEEDLIEKFVHGLKSLLKEKNC
jgi:probable rRNA maturation factor